MAKPAQPKKVRLNELKPGLRVVVNALTDTYIYTVQEVSSDGLRAWLTYRAGAEEVGAGWTDYSMMCHPTAAQYEHAFAELAAGYGLEVDHTPGGKVAGVAVSFHIMLDAPKGKLFKGTQLHCDGSIQGNDNQTRTDWTRCFLELETIVAEGFIDCPDADCEYCHPDE